MAKPWNQSSQIFLNQIPQSMDPKPPQLQDENPPKIPSNPTQNHIRFPNTTTPDKCNFVPFHQRRRKLERFMDTFRTVVIKIASSGGPLTAARQMLIEERLRDFFTDFHTPDHPTYSAMIHRAIRHLNEEGGSSEESISEFIRKQFDDLPWAHSTLLKHHLRKLCECGEIVVTSDLRYLLADAITNTTSNLYSDPRRQQMKRKWSRKRKQSRGRSRRRKKDKFDKESRENEQMEIIGVKNDLTEKQVEVIGGQYQVREEHDDMTGIENQVEEQQNELIESESKEQENGLIGQNQEQEQENGVCEGQNQPIEQHNDTTDEQNQPPEEQTEVIEEENQPLELQHEVTEGKNYQEQQLEIVPELDALDIQHKEQQREATEDQSQLVGQRNEGDCALLKKPQSQQNTMSSLPPEPQPKLMITSPDLPGASQQLDLDEKLELSNPGHPDFCCQQKHMEPYLKTMTTSLDILVNSQQQLHLDHQHEGLPESHPTTMMLPPPTTVTTFDLRMVSKMLEQEQQPGFPNSEEPSELSDEQKPPESLLITVAASLTVPVNSESLKQSQTELVKPPEAELATLEEGNELSHTLQQMRKEQRQLRRQGQKDSKSKLVTEATVIELLPSQHQQQPEVLNSEGLQERKSTEIEESSEVQQQQAKQRGRRKWAISKSKAMINSCLPLQHQLQLQLQQQPEVLNSEGLRERKSTEMEESSEVQQQQAKQSGRRKRTISKSKAMITQGVPMNSEQQEQEQLSELPNPEKSPRIKLTTAEPFYEEQKQQQKVCGKRKAPESQPAMVTGSLDLPKYSEHQPGISFPEEPVELELETLEQSSLTERMQRQIKRWGQGIPEYKPAVTSIVALLPSSHDPHQEQLELPNRERPQELNHTPAEESTQSTKQQTQLHRWQKLPISQPKTVTDSLDSPLPSQQLELEQKQELPSPERAQEQQNQQPQEKLQRRQLRSRPLEPQPVVAETMADLDPSQHQHEKQQQPESRGRGRPSKPKSDTAKTGGELSPSDHQNQHEQQQAIKSSAGEGIFFDTCGLQSQQQPELPSLKMSHELKPVEELSMTQDQQRQRAREKPRRRKSRPRSPNLEAAAATAMTELLSSQLQCEEQQQAEQQQPEQCGRGRPPLPKPYTATTVEELLPLDHQDQHQQQQQQQQQPERRGRGRPPKLKPETATTKEEMLHSANQHNPQQQQQEEEEKPKCRGRGRPPKLKPETATTKEEMLHSANQHNPQQQQQEEEEKPKCRGRGRPPKPKPDTDATMENLSLQKQQQQQPKCRGRGRHQKLDGGK